MSSALVMEPGDQRMLTPTAKASCHGGTADTSPGLVHGATAVGTAVGTRVGATPAADTALGAAGQEPGVGSGP